MVRWPGVWTSSGRPSPVGARASTSGELRGGFFEVGSVAGRGAGDEVFAGLGVDHELLRAGAAHGSGVGLDGDELEAAALEDANVGFVVLVVADVEACLVDVEGVGVLHDELPDAKEAGLGARLVAELGLNLVPDLGELLVAAKLLAGDVGDDLFVGHGEAEFGAFAVFEAEHVLAHAGPAAAGLPELLRIEGGEQELLTDAVHLFAHDGDDLVDGAVAEEEVAVDSGAELADVTGAEEELVAGDFGVCGGFAEGGDEELGPAVHGQRDAFRPAAGCARTYIRMSLILNRMTLCTRKADACC